MPVTVHYRQHFVQCKIMCSLKILIFVWCDIYIYIYVKYVKLFFCHCDMTWSN